jgi:RNA polymerase sigma-70 factor (ECF subfamily)
MGPQDRQGGIGDRDACQSDDGGGDPAKRESESQQGDDERFRAARVGERKSLGELLDECRNYLLLVANRELGDEIQAKVGASDLVQETFVEALRIFERFEGNSLQELRLWLARILEFKIAQATRRFIGTEMRNARREVPLDVFSEDLGPALWVESDRTGTPPEEQNRNFTALRMALERLPPAYRQAIQMRNFEQRSFAELAAKLERTTDAARRLWLRAVVRLRSELTGMSEPRDSRGADNEQRPIDS